MNRLVPASSICNYRTIGVTRIGQLVLRGWDNVLITDAATTTTRAVLTITTHTVIFHTLVSYKRLQYIQPPLLARSSLLNISWVLRCHKPGSNVGSLLHLFTVAVVPTLPDVVSLWMTASFWYFGAVCMGPNPMRPWYFSRTYDRTLSDCGRAASRPLGN